MAVTVEDSAQYAKLGNERDKIELHEWGGTFRPFFFEFTQGTAAGDAGSEANLVELPAGKARVYCAEARIYHSAFGAARTLDVGWRAYRDLAGVDQPETKAGLASAKSVAAVGNIDLTGVIGLDETKLFANQGGVTLFASVAGGTIPAGAVVRGYVMVGNK